LSLLVGAFVVALSATACIGGPPAPPPPPNVVVFGDSNAWGIGCSLGDDAGYGASWCAPQGGVSARNETEGTCSINTNVALLYNGGASPALCSDWASKWPGILDETQPKLVILNTGGWEIVDRWTNFPAGPNCSQGLQPSVAYNCPPPDQQWGDTAPPAALDAAKNAYTSQLNAAIDLFRTKGAKVLVVNSPYYAPTEAQVPGLALVWYESDSQTQPANWSPPNVNVQYRWGHTKIDEFNTAVQEVVNARDPNNVKLFDLNAITSYQGQYAETIGDVQMREQDHVHLSQAAFQQVIMPAMLPVIQQMLS
jgi:lysophospholipase L1-like esterase